MNIRKAIKVSASPLLTGMAIIATIYFFIGHSIEYNSAIFHQPSRHISGLFNSNQLNIAYLYQDLFIHHAPIKDWFFSPVPYFFPDVLIYFILMSVLKDFFLAALLTNSTLIFLYYLLIVAIGTEIYGKKSKNLFRLSGILSLFLASSHLGDSEILVPLWSSHFGSTVVMFLWGIFLILKIFHLFGSVLPRSLVGATGWSPILEIQKTTNKVINRIVGDQPVAPTIHLIWDNVFKKRFISIFYKQSNIKYGNKAAKQSSKFLYSLLATTLFLTSLSDPLFFVLFIPSICIGLLALTLKRIINKRCFFTMSTIIFISGLLGFISNYSDFFHLNIQRTHVSTPLKTTLIQEWHFVIQAAIHLQENFSLYYHHNPAVILIAFFFLLFGIKLFFKSDAKTNPNSLFIFITTAFCMLIAIFSSIFLDPDLNLPTFSSLRHFQIFMLFPTFLCLPLMLAPYKKITGFINHYYIYFIISILSCLFLFSPHYSFNTMLHFQSPVTECIDNYSKQGKLISKNGISAYWDAHIIDMFSHENINIVAVTHTPLKPYNWMGTQHDYINKKFNFILLKKHTAFSRVASQHWNKPNNILICPQNKNYSLYIYNQGFHIDKL